MVGCLHFTKGSEIISPKLVLEKTKSNMIKNFLTMHPQSRLKMNQTDYYRIPFDNRFINKHLFELNFSLKCY